MIQKLLRHRFLFEELVKRDFKKKYKRTVLGMIWSLLSPLLMLLVMALVFTQFFGQTTEHYIIYLFCGNLIFSYFSEATNGGMNALMANSDIFTKVDVPKYMFLFSRIVQAFINFLLTFAVFLVFVGIEGLPFRWSFFLILYPIFFLSLLNIGVGMILSALFIFFRDIEYLYTIFTQLLMYLSAIFYTITAYPQQTQQLFYLNPLYVYIYYLRCIVIEGTIPTAGLHILAAVYALIFLAIGCWMYKRYNHQFLYYV